VVPEHNMPAEIWCRASLLSIQDFESLVKPISWFLTTSTETEPTEYKNDHGNRPCYRVWFPICTSLTPRPMTMTFGHGTRLCVHVCIVHTVLFKWTPHPV